MPCGYNSQRSHVIIIIIARLITRHSYVNRSEAMNRRRGRSSSVVTQPSTSHHLCCVCSVCACALLYLAFIIAVHLGNMVTFYPLSPLTSQFKVFLQCYTDHFKSPCAGDCIDARYESQKYHRRWGANPSPVTLQASALTTRPP